jgi:amidohydrolase
VPVSAALAHELHLLRRDLHREPEVGLDLPKTQRRIVQALEGLDIEVSLGGGLTSVVGIIRGQGAGPAVLLRGDMDALPMTESATNEPRSLVDGSMHACGHDLHVAALVGAAHLLCGRRDQLFGDVVLMFQPGEEGCNGASVMLDEGVLDAAGSRVVAAYALHVTSGGVVPNGVFASRPGAIMSASHTLRVTVLGRGGHGSAPHLAKDPVPIACEMIQALQTIVTRSFDVFDPVVASVGSIHGGTKNNIIPDDVTFDVTLRSFSEQSGEMLKERLPRMIRAIAEAHGLSADVEFAAQYPVMANDQAETAFARDVVRQLFGDDAYQELTTPLTSSEDFAWVLGEVPGSYLMVGACPTGLDPLTAPYNHSPNAQFDESVIARCADYLSAVAIQRLRQERRSAGLVVDGTEIA